jgi:predicted permease
MSLLRNLVDGLRSLFRKEQVERELDEELRAYLEMEAMEKMKQGMSRKDALREVRLERGSVDAAKEVVRSGGWESFVETCWQDLRYGLRMLRKSPGFTTVAILTLALGIGANTAIFTLVDAVMLKDLPVPQPKQLYRLGDSDNCCQMTGTQNGGSFVLYSYPLYRYLREHTSDFVGLAAFSPSLNSLSVRRSGVRAPAQPAIGEYVSGNYFETLGAPPAAGRLLAAADDNPASPPAAVMSYRTWEQNYGGDPTVVGASFAIDGQPMTVVGVAPSGFLGETLRSDPPDFWIPLSQEPALDRSGPLLNLPLEWWLYIIGRIGPGESPSLAQAHLTVELQQWLWASESANATPQERSDTRLVQEARSWLAQQHVHLTPAASGVTTLRSASSEGLLFLMVVSGLVLLIACANLANLLLARSMAKRQETAMRIALGAGRSRIIRQTFTEGILLALLGGVAALAVAFGGTQAILLLAFRGAMYIPIHARPSLPVLGFTLVLSLMTGIIFSLVPAWTTSQTNPLAELRKARSIRGSSAVPRNGLVVLQAALSLVLLVAAGLLTRSLFNLEHQQFGFDARGRWLVKIDPALAGYTRQRLPELYQKIEQGLSQIPGVLSVGFSNYSPLSGDNPNLRVYIEGRRTNPDDNPSISWDQVSPRYFETIGTRVLLGRSFTEHDTIASEGVAVINEAFARRFLPNENPIGQHFGTDPRHSGDLEIVGVVENAKYLRASEPVGPMFFVPLLQPPDYAHDIELRLAGRSENLDAAIRSELAHVDPNLTVLAMVTLSEQVSLNFYRERLLSRLTLLYALLALLLASVGLYGVASYVVARRTNEIGVRMALGATRASILRWVLRGAMLQTALGLAIGLPVAVGAGAVLSNSLYGVERYDPFIFGCAIAALVVCTGFGALTPARRAMRIDPMVALRHE